MIFLFLDFSQSLSSLSFRRFYFPSEEERFHLKSPVKEKSSSFFSGFRDSFYLTFLFPTPKPCIPPFVPDSICVFLSCLCLLSNISFLLPCLFQFSVCLVSWPVRGSPFPFFNFIPHQSVGFSFFLSSSICHVVSSPSDIPFVSSGARETHTNNSNINRERFIFRMRSGQQYWISFLFLLIGFILLILFPTVHLFQSIWWWQLHHLSGSLGFSGGTQSRLRDRYPSWTSSQWKDETRLSTPVVHQTRTDRMRPAFRSSSKVGN